MATFLDELARLNSQNFLGGIAEAGSAIKEQRQNERLVQLYDEFRKKSTEPLPTGEQIEQFRKHVISETGGDLVSRDKIDATPDVKATMNLYRSMDRMGALSNIYQPYISAFATLGEDGVRIADSLSKELGTKLAIEEGKGNLPFRELQLKNLQLEYDWNKDKYVEWNNEVTKNKEIAEITDYIMGNDLFGEIEGGDVTTWSTQKLADFNAKQKAVIQDAYNKFEGRVSEGTVAKAFKMAMDLTGKSFKYTPHEYNQTNSGFGLTELDMQSYLSNLRAWSQQWINMNPQLRRAVKDYLQSGTLPSKDEANIGIGITPERVKDLAKIYAPDGLYMQYYSILAGTVPGFTNTKDVKLANGKTRAPMLEGTEDIIRPYGMTGFIKGQYNYNPYEWIKLNKANEDALNKISDESMFQKGGEPESNVWNWLYNDFGLKEFDPTRIEGFPKSWGEFFGTERDTTK